MFSFNRNEQIVLLLLSAALIVGVVVSLLDRYTADGLPDFEVRKGAVAVPQDTASISQDTAPVPPDTASAPQAAVHAPTGASRAPLDLNGASEADLQALPGIGPQIARRIVAHRSEHGPFRSLEDLMAVRGIGPKTVERLRPLATVTAP